MLSGRRASRLLRVGSGDGTSARGSLRLTGLLGGLLLEGSYKLAKGLRNVLGGASQTIRMSLYSSQCLCLLDRLLPLASLGSVHIGQQKGLLLRLGKLKLPNVHRSLDASSSQ